MRKRFLLAVGVCVLTCVPIALETVRLRMFASVFGDFKAFYCAARVAASGHDPYKAVPLQVCETFAVPDGLVHGYAVPAPLPGYAIGMLAPFADIPYAIAAGLWFALTMIAFAICIYALTRLTDRSTLTVFAAFALSLGVPAIPYGQIVPIAIAALALAALSAERGHWPQTAAAAAVSLVEPHLGLAACAALFIWAPRTRAALGISAIVLGLLSVLAIGISGNVEYVTRILPAHAASELSADIQYSLAVVLHALGVGDSRALSIATASYGAMLVIGVFLGQVLSSRFKSPALLVAIPVAVSVVGGPYIHVTQIAAAIPAALILFDRAPQFRAALTLVVLLLAVPWLWAGTPVLATAALFPVAWLAWDLSEGDPRFVIASVSVATVLAMAPNFLTLTHAHAAIVDRGIDPSLPEAQWSRAIQLLASTESPATWLVRAPTWLGLLMLICVAFAASRLPERPPMVHVT
ncbi:MAG: glycosyltransferase 87 family protein [Vulcanimicrobiaceae bacterium]